MIGDFREAMGKLRRLESLQEDLIESLEEILNDDSEDATKVEQISELLLRIKEDSNG